MVMVTYLSMMMCICNPGLPMALANKTISTLYRVNKSPHFWILVLYYGSLMTVFDWDSNARKLKYLL